MAFPTVVATAQWEPGSSLAAHRATMPAGVALGDLLLCFEVPHTGGSFTINSKWTLITDPVSTGFHVFYCIADGTEVAGTTYVVGTYGSAKFGGSTTYLIRDYEGVPEAAPDVVAVASVADVDPPVLTPSGGLADYLWIVPTRATLAGLTATPPSGFANNIAGPASGMSALSFASSRRNLNAASLDPGVVTWSSATSLVATTVSVKGITPPPAGRSFAAVL